MELVGNSRERTTHVSLTPCYPSKLVGSASNSGTASDKGGLSVSMQFVHCSLGRVWLATLQTDSLQRTCFVLN